MRVRCRRINPGGLALAVFMSFPAQAMEADFTFLIPVETRDVPDIVSDVFVGCTVRTAQGKMLAEKLVSFSETEITKSVMIELRIEDRSKVNLADNWECGLSLQAGAGSGGLAPNDPAKNECELNTRYWYLCGREGADFRVKLTGRFE